MKWFREHFEDTSYMSTRTYNAAKFWRAVLLAGETKPWIVNKLFFGRVYSCNNDLTDDWQNKFMQEEIGRRIPGCLNMAVLGFNFLEDTER
jgi:hypothetical protein